MQKNSYSDYILDLLLPLGEIKARKMFGGLGIYKGNLFFGLISDNILYFKVDEATKVSYETAGSKPFTYMRNNKLVALSYWEVPIHILESQDKLRCFVNDAIKAAQRTKK